MTRRSCLAALLAVSLTLAACGGDDGGRGGADGRAATPRGPDSAALRAPLATATAAQRSDFPAVRGRSLREVADSLDGTGPEVGLATSVFVAGRPRFAFGLIDPQEGFVYAPVAVYLARGGPNAAAAGPFLAAPDLLVTDAPFRSQTAATESDPFAAVYDARVEATRPGRYSVLVVSKVQGGDFGSATAIEVVDGGEDPIPDVGERPPSVPTDTPESAGGDIASIDTRLPPSELHESSLDDVLGTRPVALLFATPQLCQSRVCGPVVDLAVQLEKDYGDRIAFIHQEVFVDNEVSKGFRPPLAAFDLRTEPWLFTIRADGTVAARLEGSFGFRSFEAALRAAL